MAGLFDALWGELRYAVQDIRQKVVEQGWFGQVTTAKPVNSIHHFGSAPSEASHEDLYGRDLESPLDRRPSFEEQWRAREPEPDKAPQKEVDRGIDR